MSAKSTRKRSRATKSPKETKPSKTTKPQRKRILVFLITIIVLVGAFLYIGNPDIRARVDSWMGINQTDSVEQKSDSDKKTKSKPKKKTTEKNKKNTKAIKPDE